ncbi:hypothetical protein [Erythrobacter sp. THAF29]|uniref:hypothetical protein n=1 Tax=Erythrobacter sp. THAF29 TaxID=2587851 RepID=UPI0012691403|nr:hypothetical protein [Erythrobacter sp. THAF29]
MGAENICDFAQVEVFDMRIAIAIPADRDCEADAASSVVPFVTFDLADARCWANLYIERSSQSQFQNAFVGDRIEDLAAFPQRQEGCTHHRQTDKHKGNPEKGKCPSPWVGAALNRNDPGRSQNHPANRKQRPWNSEKVDAKAHYGQSGQLRALPQYTLCRPQFTRQGKLQAGLSAPVVG